MAVIKTLHNAAEVHDTPVFDWKDTQEENAITANVRIIVECVLPCIISTHCAFFHCLIQFSLNVDVLTPCRADNE